jgi:protein HOOK3
LDAITARNHKLETEYLDILQDKLGLETALQDLREPSREPEENVPFLEQRKKLQAAQTEIQDMRNQQFGTNTEMANIKERLIAVQKQLTDQDVQLDGNAEYQTLTDRYSELHKHSEGVEAELAEQRALLRHALLNAAQLLKESAESRNENEYKLLLQQLQAVRDAPDDDELLESTAAQLADRMEQARSDTVAANKVCHLANSFPENRLTPRFSSPKTVQQRSQHSRNNSARVQQRQPRVAYLQPNLQHSSVKISS